MMNIKKKIGIIGCGTMGGALIDALLKNNAIKQNNLFITDADTKKAKSITKTYKKLKHVPVGELLRHADIVVLAVKPQNLQDLMKTVTKNSLQRCVFVSILAGVTIKKLQTYLGKKAIIVRAMPNLGLVARKSVTALCGTRTVGKKAMQTVRQLFSVCGTTLIIPERYMNVVTAISGSGPAYYFYLTELLIAEGKKNGLKTRDAGLLAKKTAEAAGALMIDSSLAPDVWRKSVTSRGGTTEAAFNVLLNSQVARTFSEAVSQAIRRGKELSA